MRTLILGGGINGAALARELAARGCSVTLVDRWDLASGATSASSRLIHGGLRYLEYREFPLVREALLERRWLLQAAPHLVRPLQLFIPLAHRASGLVSGAKRFLGWERTGRASPPRGLWPVRAGLTLYDWYARGGLLPSHTTHRASDPHARLPRVAENYRWLCSYYDGQVPFAERLVFEFLADAGRLAAQHDRSWTVHTYCDVRIEGGRLQFRNRRDNTVFAEEDPHAYDVVVNATGAWVDVTLERLHIPSPRLMGGTKGSHILTDHGGLRDELQGRAIYAEAEDGRVAFVLPFGQLSLIGTTDVPFEGPPETARATEQECRYLLDLVRRVFPHLALRSEHVVFHYSGVRPLPYRERMAADPSAVTRSHQVVAHQGSGPPMISLIGGKLTTCRALARDAARFLIRELQLPLAPRWGATDSGQTAREDHPLPGGVGAAEPAGADRVRQELREQGFSSTQAEAHWNLFGMRAAEVVRAGASGGPSPAPLPDTGPLHKELPHTELSLAAAHYGVGHEWAETLADLVERRLMLLYHQRLTRPTLRALAKVLVQHGKLAGSQVEQEVERYERDLRQRLGLQVVTKEASP